MANIRKPKYQIRVNNPDAITDIDVLETIQSQYAASPHILALLVNKAAIADPGKDLEHGDHRRGKVQGKAEHAAHHLGVDQDTDRTDQQQIPEADIKECI